MRNHLKNLVRGGVLGGLMWLPAACSEDSPPPPAAQCGDLGTICTVMGNGVHKFAGEGASPEDVSLYAPTDITFDAQDRLVVLDFNNQRIRRLDLDGRVRTIVGTGLEDHTTKPSGTPGLETPLNHAFSMVYDEPGNMFIAGYHVPWVLRMDMDDNCWVYAGIDTPGYAGDGGPADSATFDVPAGVAVAAAGVPVYISDAAAHCVRWVDANGTVRTFCGNGTPGYSGDGGPATEAILNQPYRVRYDDATGAVYICDYGNHVVRRIDASGIITTVAGNGTRGAAGDGGPATEAMLDTPLDARPGPDGALYIADRNSNRIRRVDASGIITTVVGDGVAGYTGDGGPASGARIFYPYALAFDAAGNLYFTDTNNSVIRKIVLVTP
ncbi:MAG TPA: hypothetical protein VFP10_05015 [Candidatus Eisenbacteria bacterium]|nr:hypothetical protein [Candidatus Eisenbacteria bacterium]